MKMADLGLGLADFAGRGQAEIAGEAEGPAPSAPTLEKVAALDSVTGEGESHR